MISSFRSSNIWMYEVSVRIEKLSNHTVSIIVRSFNLCLWFCFWCYKRLGFEFSTPFCWYVSWLASHMAAVSKQCLRDNYCIRYNSLFYHLKADPTNMNICWSNKYSHFTGKFKKYVKRNITFSIYMRNRILQKVKTLPKYFSKQNTITFYSGTECFLFCRLTVFW